ncbi:hypothetical protein JCM6882_007328 [Rhodosporidiobolus microsporus]
MRSLGLLFTVATGALAAPASTSSTGSPSTGSSSASHSIGSGVYDLKEKGFTSQKWIDALHKARDVVSQLTFEEKVNFTNIPPTEQGCAGVTSAITRFGIPQICFADGPTGVKTRFATQLPTEVTSGATWDVELISKRAHIMSKEYHDIGVQVPLSIVAGPMGRSPWGGRNWENWSPDPYLTGIATRVSIEAFQKNGVVGQVKHYLGNEQEYLRMGVGIDENTTVSSVIDAATTRELYVWPYAEAIRHGASSVMCSYNKINGTLGCENHETQNELLKTELNFGGSIVSDWFAAHNPAEAALFGLDYVQPNNIWGSALGDLIQNGTLPDTIIDDKIVRTLTPYYALNQASLPSLDYTRSVISDESTKLVYDIAAGSLTLLKNARAENETRGLPLKDPKTLVLVGSPAGPGPYGLVSNIGGFGDVSAKPGFTTEGTGSGGAPAAYSIDPFNGVTARARKQKPPTAVDAFLTDDPLDGQTASSSQFNIAARGVLESKLEDSETAVVFVMATAGEGEDRTNLSLALGGDELVKYVASRHNDTVVVVTAPGQVDMSQWIDHSNVTAVLYAYFPTIEGGNAVASVLFGDVSPSGKLPFTLARSVDDYLDLRYTGNPNDTAPVTEFSEGPFIDYRRFDAEGIEPQFEFGFGKSYSTFSFKNLSIKKNTEKRKALVRETNEVFLSGDKTTPGLYDRVYTVKAVVKNTGSVAAAEVAQLYLSFPSSTPRKLPVRQLRGFTKPFLKPGESKTVEFELRNKDLAYYNVEKGGWVIPEGEFTVSVGNSSRKLPLTGTIQR